MSSNQSWPENTRVYDKSDRHQNRCWPTQPRQAVRPLNPKLHNQSGEVSSQEFHLLESIRRRCTE
jgi:hypothetical protein